MSEYMKKACEHCPFRRDVRPFLRPERAEEIAYNALNRYGSFTCHKTLECDDESGDNYTTHTSKECAGHLTLQHHENGENYYSDEGFQPDPNCYESAYDMVEAYELEADRLWEQGE